ncbi:oligo-1,6-glucosidase [Quadrisphaera granulorum]|uniref:Oligo-1,6-glucosidase n=1 Tax=Quadrisphaera granulorum TaxID=317664 RepID=A0A315ZRF2_9ACTN|nr:alpha-glucosidase [Quadrisphaera granulorum]PWJ47869.1 oligo-1,6-glucosidase [Quadrisphaera granulorum]SZE98636.1 oligo-1,6-glucosidase [Quadrisphaera granulorum]
MTATELSRTSAPVDSAASDWWKSAVVYQVYPRSFADSNGDGVGDLRGLIEHLDHIAGLGVDVIWLSPMYPSPQADNGYDISDYRDVDPTFGTLADMDELIRQVHARGMKIILDLVVNHTSDEHPWFQSSRSSRTGERADWYIWRDPRPGVEPGTPGAEPNNWGSFFSGPAWTWVPERGQYYLHLFAAKQPDLNWDCPEVRAEVFATMRWWLDRGVDGFRMDVINFISKDPALPDGPLTSTGLGDGSGSFAYGPRVHEYLAEMKDVVFTGRDADCLTVGEMPNVTPEQALRFTDCETGQLCMVFQFEHVDLDQDGSKWAPRPVSVVDLKTSLGRWQRAMGDRGWNSLYWNNHDQPRVVSRFGDDRQHWYESATALATVLHLHRGTPYIYQGEELGMTNAPFERIEDFRDIESTRYYETAVLERGADADEVLAALRRKGRDNARTPVQWTAGAGAGFTTGEPWIPVNPNHVWLNAAAQRDDPASVYAYYRRLVDLRHRDPVVVHGDFTMLQPEHPTLYAFARCLDGARLAVYANLSGEPLEVDVELPDRAATTVLTNLTTSGPWDGHLLPWEVRVLRSDVP